MNPQVIKVGKYLFEIGFKWYQIIEDSKIKEIVKEKGGQAYTLIDSSNSIDASMLGVLEKKESQGRSYSLLSYVTDVVSTKFDVETFVFIKELANGDYYHAFVESGSPSDESGSDNRLPYDTDVAELLNAYSDDGVVIYIDSSNPHSICECDYIDFKMESYFGSIKPSARHQIMTLKQSSGNIKTVAMLLCAIIAIWLIWPYATDFFKEKEVVKKAPSREELLAISRKKAKAKVNKRLKQRTSSSSPSSIVTACSGGYFEMYPQEPVMGWTNTQVKCNSGGIKATYTQDDVFNGSVESFNKQMESKGASVSISNDGRWLYKSSAKFKLKKALVARKGLTVDELPNKSEVDKNILSTLKDERLRGLFVGKIKESFETFRKEDEIPNDLNYMVGTAVLMFPDISMIDEVVGQLDHQYVSISNIDFYDEKFKRPKEADDPAIEYKVVLNYFFK